MLALKQVEAKSKKRLVISHQNQCLNTYINIKSTRNWVLTLLILVSLKKQVIEIINTKQKEVYHKLPVHFDFRKLNQGTQQENKRLNQGYVCPSLRTDTILLFLNSD